MFKNLLNRLLGLIVAVIFLGGWLYLPINIKKIQSRLNFNSIIFYCIKNDAKLFLY